MLEKGLILRGHIFGLDSKEVKVACRSVAKLCSFVGLKYCQEGPRTAMMNNHPCSWNACNPANTRTDGCIRTNSRS